MLVKKYFRSRLRCYCSSYYCSCSCVP